MMNKYEQLIIENLVSSLSIDYESLRWFPFFPILPNNNCDLFHLFDVVQKKSFFYEGNSKQMQFSTSYGELLEAQKQSFVTDIAKKNYGNKGNWLNCSAKNVPLYSPNLDQISEAIANGTAFDFTFDSTNFTFDENDLSPIFTSLLINPSFLNLNDISMPTRFIFKIHFDKVAHVPIQYGNWYSSAAFIAAYKNQDDWMSKTGLITWDSLFGTNGILNFITNGFLVASGMDIEIQFFGDYNEDHLESLKSTSQCSDSSFYLNAGNSKIKKVLNEENNLILKINSTNKSILMLALQVAKTQQIMS